MPGDPHREPEINKLFRLLLKHQGTDLYLEPDASPQLKIGGVVRRAGITPLSQDDVLSLLHPIMDVSQQRTLAETGEVKFTHGINLGDNQFEIQVVQQQGRVRVSARTLAPS